MLEPFAINEPTHSTPEFLEGLLAHGRNAFFFDVDGTLLDIKPEPGDVIAGETLKTDLIHLAQCARGAVALVSGRKIEDLDRIFFPLTLPASGMHGAQIRRSNTIEFLASDEDIRKARPEVEGFAARFPSLFLEDKGMTLAVHFRKCPELSEIVRVELSVIGSKYGLALQEGKMVVELKPDLFDKGTAIKAFLAVSPFMGRKPVFFGDDLTDEKGFDVVNAFGGVTVKIGASSMRTSARYQLSDPEDLRLLLRQIR